MAAMPSCLLGEHLPLYWPHAFAGALSFAMVITVVVAVIKLLVAVNAQVAHDAALPLW